MYYNPQIKSKNGPFPVWESQSFSITPSLLPSLKKSKHNSSLPPPYLNDKQNQQKINQKITVNCEVLNHTRFERITFRSGGGRATVAPAVPFSGGWQNCLSLNILAVHSEISKVGGEMVVLIGWVDGWCGLRAG